MPQLREYPQDKNNNRDLHRTCVILTTSFTNAFARAGSNLHFPSCQKNRKPVEPTIRSSSCDVRTKIAK